MRDFGLPDLGRHLHGGLQDRSACQTTGVSHQRKADGSYTIGSRSVVRYTFSKHVHIEGAATIDVHTVGMPKTRRFELLLRYNM